MIDFGVASKRQVLIQQLSYRVAGAAICAAILCNAVGTLGQFVLDVMTDQGAKFEIV